MTHREDESYMAQRLNQLLNEKRGTDGKPYSLRQVARGVNAMTGEKLLSYSHLSLLRAGKRQNPSFRVVVALARWFGVETDYFSDLVAATCPVSDSNGVPRSEPRS